MMILPLMTLPIFITFLDVILESILIKRVMNTHAPIIGVKFFSKTCSRAISEDFRIRKASKLKLSNIS